jgi:hypothetical protein
MQALLDVVGGPPWPHGEFQRPGRALFVNNAVHIDVTGVSSAADVISQRQQELLG